MNKILLRDQLITKGVSRRVSSTGDGRGEAVPKPHRPLRTVYPPFRWDGYQVTVQGENRVRTKWEEHGKHNALIGGNRYRGDSQEGAPCQLGAILHGSYRSEGGEGERKLGEEKEAGGHQTEHSYTTFDFDRKAVLDPT